MTLIIAKILHEAIIQAYIKTNSGFFYHYFWGLQEKVFRRTFLKIKRLLLLLLWRHKSLTWTPGKFKMKLCWTVKSY